MKLQNRLMIYGAESEDFKRFQEISNDSKWFEILEQNFYPNNGGLSWHLEEIDTFQVQVF